MISNLTAAEWDAFLSAFVLADVTWEQDGEAEDRRKRVALQRAFPKIRQLAPKEAS